MIYLLFIFLKKKKKKKKKQQHLVDVSILEAAMFTHGYGCGRLNIMDGYVFCQSHV